jgi:hypothetical protein
MEDVAPPAEGEEVPPMPEEESETGAESSESTDEETTDEEPVFPEPEEEPTEEPPSR